MSRVMNMIPPKFIALGVAALISIFIVFNFSYNHLSDSQPSTSISSHWWHRPAAQNVLSDIYNSTLGFQKVFALNMPSRSDKRDSMSLAASLTGFKVEYMEGILGATVPNKALPVGQTDRKMSNATIGSWRAHMNAIRTIVEEGYSSALILEDDADWDIRIKSQLADFALGSRFFLGNASDAATFSPYGDGWDVLWVGLCHDDRPKDDGRVYVINNDLSVPTLGKLQINNPEMMKEFPDHSRIIHITGGPICTYAYALSLAGARKVLYALSVKELRGIFDNALAWWCMDKSGLCISANPTYFQAHRFAGGAGKGSDINPGVPELKEGKTLNIRWSTKLNIDKLLAGETDYHDQFPD